MRLALSTSAGSLAKQTPGRSARRPILLDREAEVRPNGSLSFGLSGVTLPVLVAKDSHQGWFGPPKERRVCAPYGTKLTHKASFIACSMLGFAWCDDHRRAWVNERRA
jgi:hypothetical protein